MWIDLRNGIAIVLLAAAAIATFYWSRPSAPPAAARVAGDSPPLGYYARGVRMLGTDEQGRVTYRLSSDRLEELPNQALLELDGVHVEYLPADQTAWVISATRASTPKDRSHFDLEGDVEIRNQPKDGSDPIVIATTRLRFVPDDSTAVSEDPVRLQVGGSRFDAVGVRLHLKDDKVELKSAVHGQVAP